MLTCSLEIIFNPSCHTGIMMTQVGITMIKVGVHLVEAFHVSAYIR